MADPEVTIPLTTGAPNAPTPPDPVVAQNRQMWADRMTHARQSGASWDQIHADIGRRMVAARTAGATDQQLQREMGFNNPDEMVASMQQDTHEHLAATKPTSLVDAFVGGLTHSSLAALIGVTPTQDIHAGDSHSAAISSAIGETVGDLPASILGGMGGALAGAGGGAVAGGGPENVPADAGGGFIGAAVGATALPQLIKSERQRFVDALFSGQIHSAADFLRIQGDVTVDTAKAGLVGAATAGMGRVVAPLARRMGAGRLATAVATVGAESATMTAAQAALAGKMPSMEDFIDSSITVGAMHTGMHFGPKALAAVRTRLQQNYVDTGESPTDAAARAMRDPAFRSSLIGQPRPEVPPGSSTAAVHPPAARQPGVLPGPHTPTSTDTFTVPRAVGSFDAAVPWILQHEGGMTTDQGGLTNFGISHNANPDVDIAHLTRQDAIALYHARYWTAIDADHLPDNMKLAAFDSAVNEGVGATRSWLREAGGDLQAFMRLRAERYARLARSGKYTEAQVRSWGNRMRDLGASDGMAGVVERGTAHVGEEFSPEDAAHLDLEAKPSEGETISAPRPEPTIDRSNEGNPLDILGLVRRPPPPPGAPPPPIPKSEDGPMPSADPVATVLSRQGEITDPSWIDKLRGTLKDIYLEMFNGKHSIHVLANALHAGGPIDDARNPEFLHRLAELTDTPSEYAIEIGMLGLDGSKTKTRGLRALMMQGKGAAGRADHRNFMAYLMSKFAVEKAAQGKETGISRPDAEEVVRRFEAGGTTPAGEDLDAHAARIGTKINVVGNGAMMQKYGPHFDITNNVIRMPNMTDEEYVTKYGATRETIKAHEMGHAIAASLGRNILHPDWSHLSERDQQLLGDDLHVASLRFKPEMWADKNKLNQAHYNKPAELMADAIATWMTDPTARSKMPDFQRILEREMGPKFDIEKTLGAIPERWGTDMQQRASEIQDWQNGTLRWLRDAGIISSDSYRRWNAFNEARIPGFRIQEGERPGVGAPGATVFNPVKEFKGSDKEFEPIYANMQKEAYMRFQLAKTNEANLAVADAAEMLGTGSKRPVANYDAMKTLAQLGHAGIDDDVIGSVARQLLSDGTIRKDEVPIFRDGKLEAWKFDDPDLVRTLRGYDKVTIGTIGKIVATATNLFRKGIVLPPTFALKLATYDLQFQTIFNPDARNAVLGFMQGMGHTLGKSEVWDEWMRSGGAEKVFDGMSRDAAIKARLAEVNGPKSIQGAMASGLWNGVRTPFRMLSAWGRTISQFQRVGRFAQGREAGESMTRAAVASTEAAFHRPGFGGPYSRAINQVVPFFTAHLNGLEKTTRALLGGALGDTNTTVLGTKYNAANAWMKGAAIITVPMMLQWFHDRDKEWYKAIPAWQKGMGFWMHFGGDAAGNHGTTVAIPYPPLASLIFGEIPRRAMEQFFDDNPHAWDDFGKSAFLSLMPPGTITGMSIMQPIIEGATNHSFLQDAPLVSDETRAHTGAAEQGVEYSSAAAKALARFADDMPLTHLHLGWSPPIIDNYIREWGGSLGAMANWTATQLSHAGQRNAAPATSVSDWPMVSSWTSRYPSASSAPLEQFYRTSATLTQTHNSINEMIRMGDWNHFKELVDHASPTAVAYQQFRLQNDAPPNVDTSRYADYLAQRSSQADGQALELIKEAEKAMHQAHDYARSVYENPDLTASDKRQMLDATNATVQMMSERANEVFDRALIGTSRPGHSAQQPVPEQFQFTPPDQQ